MFGCMYGAPPHRSNITKATSCLPHKLFANGECSKMRSKEAGCVRLAEES